jgi:hypothetical protein
MKRTILSLAALLLINFSPLPAFAGEQERPATAPTATQQREQYVKSIEERLGRLGQQLDELKAKAAGKTEQARVEMKQFLVEAEKKQQAASLKLEEMRKASKNMWLKFTSDMNKAADDFEQAYERAKSRFKE